jgi:hypothetical protein
LQDGSYNGRLLCSKWSQLNVEITIEEKSCTSARDRTSIARSVVKTPSYLGSTPLWHLFENQFSLSAPAPSLWRCCTELCPLYKWFNITPFSGRWYYLSSGNRRTLPAGPTGSASLNLGHQQHYNARYTRADDPVTWDAMYEQYGLPYAVPGTVSVVADHVCGSSNRRGGPAHRFLWIFLSFYRTTVARPTPKTLQFCNIQTTGKMQENRILYALCKVRRRLRHNLCSQPYGSKSLVRSTGSAV